MIAEWMRAPRFSGVTVLYLVASTALWVAFGPRCGIAAFLGLGLIAMMLHAPPCD